MRIDNNNIHAILAKYNVVPSKNKGQNFLLNHDISCKIASLVPIGTLNVVEIGPGLGAISDNLIQNINYKAIEIDNNLYQFLIEQYNNDKKKFILGNALKYDYSNEDIIIGNIPYNITSELLEKILLDASKCQKIILMTQAEVADKLCSVEGKDYSPINVLIHLLGNLKKEMNVSKNYFYPIPKCGSTVFSININNHDKNLIFVYKFAQLLFSNRRKTALNNLLKQYNKELIIEAFQALNISPLVRAEQLSPSKIKELALYINNKDKQ